MNALHKVGLLVLFVTNRVVPQQPLFRAVDIDVGVAPVPPFLAATIISR